MEGPPCWGHDVGGDVWMRKRRCWMARSMRDEIAAVGWDRKRLSRFSGGGALDFLGLLVLLLRALLALPFSGFTMDADVIIIYLLAIVNCDLDCQDVLIVAIVVKIKIGEQ